MKRMNTRRFSHQILCAEPSLQKLERTVYSGTWKRLLSLAHAVPVASLITLAVGSIVLMLMLMLMLNAGHKGRELCECVVDFLVFSFELNTS